MKNTPFTLTLKRIVLRVLVRMNSGKIIDTKDGLRIKIFDDWIVGRVIWHKSYEKYWTDIIKAYLQPGDTCLDVGANFGYYSLLMAKTVGQDGRILAIEPNDGTLPKLKKNIEINGFGDRINIHEVGASDRPSRANMANHDASSGLGYTETSETGGIEMVRLDTLLSKNTDEIAVMKVDIEGCEVGALNGSLGLLTGPNPPVVLIEYNEEALSRQDESHPQKFWQFALDNGFTVMRREGDAIVEKTDFSTAIDANYFFVPNKGTFGKRFRNLLSTR